MSIEHLRFAPAILSRLGEELIPDPDHGIIELVRNAYDADATNCTIELDGTTKTGGSVKIVDNGHGMDAETIRSGWLVLGKSAKSENRRSALGRLPVGDKGLGRLAALRMGTKAVLITRPKTQSNFQYKVIIDWQAFDSAEVVEDVPITVTQQPRDGQAGSEIHITGLRMDIGRRETQRLARSLVLLSDPFAGETNFRAALVGSEFSDLEGKVRDAYFEDAEYKVVAEIKKGRGSVEVFDWKGKRLWSAPHKRLSTVPYNTVPTTLELWLFKLDSNSFSTRKSTLGEVREWLQITGGVHLYHRGLRVRPYGDPGHDWLEMNLARARSPEERPSTNNTIGRVIVEDPKGVLIQKTDRVGFIESEQFAELRRFGKNVLDWVANERLREAEKLRARNKASSKKSLVVAKRAIKKALTRVKSKEDRAAITEAIGKLQRAASEQTNVLREDLNLYRTLATAGTTSAVFAHEAGKPVTIITKTIPVLASRAKKELGEDTFKRLLEPPLQLIERSASTLKSFAALPIQLLRKEKRLPRDVDVHKVINSCIALFKPVMSGANIDIIAEYVDESPEINGTESLLEAIVTNFLTNSVNAFTYGGEIGRPRRVIVRTEVSPGWVTISVLDSGPGIRGIAVDEVWMPGRTTIPNGTGLGLTIVKDVAHDLGGRVQALPQGELGGAQFSVSLPTL